MRAKLELGAELDVLSAKEFDRGIDRLGLIWRQAEGVKHLRIPILQGVVGAAGTILLGSEEGTVAGLSGPAQGFAWRVVRLSIMGLTAGQSIDIYTGGVRPAGYVNTIFFNPPGQVPCWTTSHGLLLHPGDLIVANGPGQGSAALDAGQTITISGEAIQAPADMISKLIGG